MLALLLSVALGTALASSSWDQVEGGAADGPTVEPAASEDGDSHEAFAVVLERGKRLYFDGKAVEAHDALRGLQVRLLLGERVDKELAAEAMIWLGEIQFRLGRSDDARDAFRWLLRLDPGWPISPYAHPMEVIGEFELVRREVQEELDGRDPTLPVVTIPPTPPWVWAPLGIPQFAQRRVGAGVAWGGLQLGLGAASIGMIAHLRFINDGPTRGDASPHPLGWDSKQVEREVQKRRYLIQWPLTFAFYGAWLGSSVDARRHWKRSHAPHVGVGALPGGSQGFVVQQTF